MGLACSLLLLAVGLYFLFATKLFPVRHLAAALKSVFNAKGKNEPSAFTSLCTNLAATLGTGNIVGVAAAILSGGPGALFWMNAAAMAGMAIKCVENALAVRYASNPTCDTGPYYYMELGLGKGYRWLAAIFALACLLSGVLGMGTVTQSNSIANALPVCLQGRNTKMILSVLITVLTALVIFGGSRRIASTAEKIIPPMAIVYLLCTIVVLFLYRRRIPQALLLILQSAFSFRAAGGGIMGMGIARALTVGVQRGVFSNEAGMGTSAISVSAAGESSPKEQGYAGIVSVFVDTVVLCTITGLMILVTGVWEETDNPAMAASMAWQAGLPVPANFTSVLMFLFLAVFGYTSIIGWNYYAERSVNYLFHSRRVTKLYQCLYLLAVFLGPFLSSEFAWRVADITNAFMILPNLLALCLLRKDAIQLLQ